MSISIYVEAIETGKYTAECEDTQQVFKADSYEAIKVEIGLHKMVCEECEHYGMWPHAVTDIEVPEVNMANGNAAAVFSALGINLDFAQGGSMSGQELLGYVLMAIATGPDDTGIAPAVTGGPEVGQRGATMVDCGMRPGYYAERFAQIGEIATIAARLGRNVYWG